MDESESSGLCCLYYLTLLWLYVLFYPTLLILHATTMKVDVKVMKVGI